MCGGSWVWWVMLWVWWVGHVEWFVRWLLANLGCWVVMWWLVVVWLWLWYGCEFVVVGFAGSRLCMVVVGGCSGLASCYNFKGERETEERRERNRYE